MFSSDTEKSGPSDAEVLSVIPLGGESDCATKVVQRDNQTADGVYPVHVRISCNDGTVGEHIYNCMKAGNSWSCPQVQK